MTEFKTMGIATNVSHSKRIWLIRHLMDLGVTNEGLREMNATDEEIEEAVRSKEQTKDNK